MEEVKVPLVRSIQELDLVYEKQKSFGALNESLRESSVMRSTIVSEPEINNDDPFKERVNSLVSTKQKKAERSESS